MSVQPSGSRSCTSCVHSLCLPLRCVDSLGEVDADGTADVGGALAGLDLNVQHGSVLVGVVTLEPGGAVHVAARKVASKKGSRISKCHTDEHPHGARLRRLSAGNVQVQQRQQRWQRHSGASGSSGSSRAAAYNAALLSPAPPLPSAISWLADQSVNAEALSLH